MPFIRHCSCNRTIHIWEQKPACVVKDNEGVKNNYHSVASLSTRIEILYTNLALEIYSTTGYLVSQKC